MNKTDLFIKENSYYIYEYINQKILKDVGAISPNYFIKSIKNIFLNQSNFQIDSNILPYFIFTQLDKKGRVDYTSLRKETINFNKINEEASTYYNYVRFSIKDELFLIKLMQTKIGGMPIDEDIVKFSKEISIDKLGLETFISENKNLLESDNKYKEIEENIKVLFR